MEKPKGVWWGPATFAIIGTLSLVAYLSPGSPPASESDLTRVHGEPTQVEVYQQARRRGTIECLKFTIGDYRAYISEYDPNYAEVRNAVQSGNSLTAWFRTDGNYGDTNERPLCRLAEGDREIVSLTDSVAQETKSRESLLVVTIACMAIGALTTAIAAWKVHRYDSWVNAVQH